MKKLCVLYSLVVAVLTAEITDLDNFLSYEKNLLFDYQIEINELRSDLLRKSWISPVMINYQENRSTQPVVGEYKDKVFSVSIDQPIFKSGGIFFAVKYANAGEKANSAEIELQRRRMIVQALEILFNLKKTRLQMRQTRLLVRNDAIDILRKKEQYENGLIDSSFLDQAIIQRNRDQTKLLALELSEENLKNSFALLSDKNPDTIKLPRLKLIEREEYKRKNLELYGKRMRIEESKYNSMMTVSKYLPTVSAYAAYYNTDHYMMGMRDDYSNYGLRISVPISVNAPHDIEASRVEYLRSAIELQDNIKKSENEYALALKTIAIIEKKIKISKADEKLYRGLLKSTRERVRAGEKTKLDIEVMRNSMRMAILDQEVYKIERQIQLLRLYEKVSGDEF